MRSACTVNVATASIPALTITSATSTSTSVAPRARRMTLRRRMRPPPEPRGAGRAPTRLRADLAEVERARGACAAHRPEGDGGPAPVHGEPGWKAKLVQKLTLLIWLRRKIHGPSRPTNHEPAACSGRRRRKARAIVRCEAKRDGHPIQNGGAASEVERPQKLMSGGAQIRRPAKRCEARHCQADEQGRNGQPEEQLDEREPSTAPPPARRPEPRASRQARVPKCTPARLPAQRAC